MAHKPLAAALRDLATMTDKVITYQQIWGMVVSGRIPAIRTATGRYLIDPGEAAAALNIKTAA